MKTVIDLGMSEGNDTAFYLAKGFKVIGVEADRGMFATLQKRFEGEIAAGTLTLFNRAASDTCDEEVSFFVHSQHQGVSGLQINKDLDPRGYDPSYLVKTINWQRLAALGAAHYVKLDIEDNETKFLTGMAATGRLPEFISVECHALQPVEMLSAMGYRRFRLIDQNAPTGFVLPAVQREGRHVDSPNFAHASGPFGLDVFEAGGWLDLERFKAAWSEAQPTRVRTWYDCHAWEPGFATKPGAAAIAASLKQWAARLGRRRA